MPDYIQLLLSSIFGLLAGLIGSAFQARIQRREKEADRVEASRERLLGNAERVFDAAEDAEVQTNAMLMQAVGRVHGEGAGEPLLPFDATGKLKTLLRVYFADCEPLIQSHLESLRVALNPLYEITRADFVGPKKELAEINKVRLETARQSAQATIEFTAKVRRAIQERVAHHTK